MALEIVSKIFHFSATVTSFPVAFGHGTRTSLRLMDDEGSHGLIPKLRCSVSAIGFTQVFSSPGPLETKTITSLVSLEAADFLEFKALNYADGET